MSEGWSSVAEEYAARVESLTASYVDALLAAVGVEAGQRVLDAACGADCAAEAAAARGAAVTATDFAPRMVALCRARVPAATVEEHDAQALPYEGCFDAANPQVVAPWGDARDRGRDNAGLFAHRATNCARVAP